MDLLSLLCIAVVEGGVSEDVQIHEPTQIRVNIQPQLFPQLPTTEACLQQARMVNPRYTMAARNEPASWGVIIQTPGTRITMIDPNSDFAGKTSPGDIVLTANGQSFLQYYRQSKNFGNAGEPVEVVIRHRNGSIECITVQKKPISSFGPFIQSAVLNHPNG